MVFAVAAIFASSLFTACSGLIDGDETNSSAATDTVLTLDAPSVSGKAYYGFNFIYWDAVASAKTYALYRDGAYLKTVTADASGATNYYYDASVADGVSYKYEVIAIADNSTGLPSRAIYVKSSKGTVSLTGNVPTQTEFTNAAKSALSVDSTGLSSKITFEEAADGYICVTFPAKAWLTYTVYSVDQGNVTDFTDPLAIANVADVFTSTSLAVADLKNESFDAHVTLAPSAGTKEIYIVAKARSALLSSSLEPVNALSKTTVTIAKIDEATASSGVTANWTDESALTARIYWTPATTSAGTADATTSFVVYRKTTAVTGTELTKLSATVTEGKSGLYYIDDTLPSGANATTYYVVHTVGTRYGTLASGTLAKVTTNYAPKATGVSYALVDLDSDGKANDFVVTIQVDNDETLTLAYTSADSAAAAEALAKTEEGTAVDLPDFYTETTSSTSSDKKAKVYTVIVKDLADASYYTLRATTALTGYETSYAYWTRHVDLSLSATAAPTLSVVKGDYDGVDTDELSNDFYITATTGNLTQTLTLYYGYDEESATAAQYNALNAPTAITLPTTGTESTAAITYSLTKNDNADGYYYFILVASEDGYVSTTSVVLGEDKAASATATPTLSVVKGDYDGVDTDKLSNDFYITVTSGNLTQTLTLYYAAAPTSAEASALLETAPSPSTWDLPPAYVEDEDAETKTYQFAVTDLEDAYYAVKVVASEDGYTSATSNVVTRQIDTTATVSTSTPSLTVTNIDTTDSTAGLYFTVSGTSDQTLTLVYGYSAISAAHAMYVAKSAPTPVTLPTTKTVNGTTVYYGWSDTTSYAAEGYYYFLLTASEDGKVDATVFDAKTVSVTESTAKSLTKPEIGTLSFEISDSDGKYNDVADFTVTVRDTNSTLRAVRYAVGLTAAQARAAVLSDENAVTLPTPAQSSADADAATYTYTFSGAIKDIEEGYYVAVIAIVTDKDTTDEDEFTDNYSVAVTSAASSVTVNTDANLKLTVSQYEATSTSNAYNDFLFNVTDTVAADDAINNYSYELQYAVYDREALSYTTSWTTLAELTMVQGSNAEAGSAENLYVATASKADMDAGYYEFRVVKTSSIDTSDDTHEVTAIGEDSYGATSYVIRATSTATTELASVGIDVNSLAEGLDESLAGTSLYLNVYTNGLASSTLAGATYTVYRAITEEAADDLISVNYAATSLEPAFDTTLNSVVVKDSVDTTGTHHYYYYVKAVYGDTTVYSNIIYVNPMNLLNP